MKRVTNSSDMAVALKRLPGFLPNRNAAWNSLIDLNFTFRCDLRYFDVIDFPVIAKLPAILSAVGENKCFIFNFENLGDDILGPAIEISATSDENDIFRKLDAARLDKAEDFLSAFYLVPRFGIVSANTDWIVLAECDERAVLLCNHEQTYASFNKIWWPAVRHFG